MYVHAHTDSSPAASHSQIKLGAHSPPQHSSSTLKRVSVPGVQGEPGAGLPEGRDDASLRPSSLAANPSSAVAAQPVAKTASEHAREETAGHALEVAPVELQRGWPAWSTVRRRQRSFNPDRLLFGLRVMCGGLEGRLGLIPFQEARVVPASKVASCETPRGHGQPDHQVRMSHWHMWSQPSGTNQMG